LSLPSRCHVFEYEGLERRTRWPDDCRLGKGAFLAPAVEQHPFGNHQGRNPAGTAAVDERRLVGWIADSLQEGVDRGGFGLLRIEWQMHEPQAGRFGRRTRRIDVGALLTGQAKVDDALVATPRQLGNRA